MIEIRSYRRVFELERRIYSIDRVRLNPAGVPVRGVVYLLALVCLALFCANVPGVAAIAREVPWYLRDLAFPAATASLLAIIRIDGRVFHLALKSFLRLLFEPRHLSALTRRSRVGERWRPSSLIALPDGSEARPRRLLYTGPGALLVRSEWAREGVHEGRGRGMGGRGIAIRLHLEEGAPVRETGEVISLCSGARALIVPRGRTQAG